VALKYPVALLNKPLAYYNQDVDQKTRGVVNGKIYEPSTFITFNLDYLSIEEKKNADLKRLLDKLRVYSLLRYRLKGRNIDKVREIISNVNFSNVQKRYFFYYYSPLWIIRLWFGFLKFGSRVKAIILR
jgi:hypothetical protein